MRSTAERPGRTIHGQRLLAEHREPRIESCVRIARVEV